MKITKHKITKQLQEQIYLVASMLPPIGKVVNGTPVYRECQIKGSELSKDDLRPGVPHIPDALYRVRRLVYEDHIQNMLRLVKRDGPQAIKDYENAVREQVKAYQLADKRERSVKNKFFKQLHNLRSWLKRTKATR